MLDDLFLGGGGGAVGSDCRPLLLELPVRRVAGTQWGNKKYMYMKHLEAAFEEASIAG